ncbi:hypothetical protein AGMMS49942_27740 [Spirochaetia bacterium]|nr:hypothetical protein AGMMS49942_27740 [Spirochaetia bacterium]
MITKTMYTIAMRIKGSSVIAVISILLYVVAIGTGIVRVMGSVNSRRELAGREFNDLVSIASDAGNRGFMEEPFKETVRNTLGSSKTLQAVIVTGPFGAEFREERVSGLIIHDGNGFRFQHRFGYSSPHSSPLRVIEPRNATITAVSNDFDFSSLQTILLQSLLIAVTAVLLSVITLLYTLWSRKTALVSDKMQKIITQSPEQEPADEESDLREMLDAELRRCSEADQDLAIILMELSPGAGAGIGDNALVYRTFGGKVRQFFTIRDIVVENGDRGMSIILPGSSLEEGFTKARQFYDQMLEGLPELFSNKDDLRIGVSALSGRILATDRLLLEASKALERAALESPPIVAFKSDPAKYKAFVQKQGKKAK